MPDETQISGKKLTAIFTAAGVFFAAAIAGYKSYDSVPVGSYGLRVTSGHLVTEDNAPTQIKKFGPGYYGKRPILDSFYSFSNNTVIMDAVVGGDSSSNSSNNSSNNGLTTQNTQDRNFLEASMRLHYRIDPSVGNMGVHLDNFYNDNGKGFLKDLMTQSVNAIAGSQPVTTTMTDPSTFLKAFIENFQWRLSQNNVPVKLDTIELLNMNSTIRKPVQLKIKPQGEVEPMVGLAVPTLVPR